MENITIKQTDENSRNSTITFKKKFGTTTYEVSVYSSKVSVETISDKIRRIIQQDCTRNQR